MLSRGHEDTEALALPSCLACRYSALDAEEEDAEEDSTSDPPLEPEEDCAAPN